MKDVLGFIEANGPRYVEELKDLVRIPSISTSPSNAGDVRRAAEWLRTHFEQMGMKATLHETARHPICFAEWNGAPGKPTVLFYGHADVQPVEPLSDWETPPFEPTEKNGNLYARGTSDDKGQTFTHVKAVEAWLRTRSELPVNVKFLIECEEEIGSINLPEWLARNKELAAADVAVISDTPQFGPGMPSLCTGLRGVAAFEIHVRTADSDLHSGSFGGAVPNAIEVLTRVMATMHDADGRVAVEGFYDSVQEATDDEKASWAALPLSDKEFLKTAGAYACYGEKGRTTLERVWSRPTLEFIGINGGFVEHGHKGVVPATAWVKCSVRQVADQRHPQIFECVRRHVEKVAPLEAKVEFRPGHGNPPVCIPVGSAWVGAAVRALERGFGTKPKFIREGGSIPVVMRFVEELNTPCLLLGFGLPDDRIHGPNEKLCIADFHAGVRTSAALLEELGKIAR